MGKRLIFILILLLVMILMLAHAYVEKSLNSAPGEKIDKCTKLAAQKEDLFVIRDNGRYGYMNKVGIVVIKPQFEDAYNFSEELARVAVHHKYGYIDKTGTLVIKPKYQYAQEFSEGLAMVAVSNKYGFVDATGKEVIPLQYEVTNSFSDGLAAVYTRDKWGYLNHKGELVIEPRFQNAGSFKEGLAPAGESNLYGYIGKNGQYVIKPQFLYAYEFSEGMAVVGMDERYGYIDASGKLVIKPVYQTAMGFSQGLAAVQKDGKWGYIDKKGNFAIRPAFDMADSFSEGLAAVSDGRNWGYIDRKGNLSIKLQYEYAEAFRNGLAHVRIDGTYAYIDLQGKLVWHEIEDVDIQGAQGILGRLIKMKLKSDQFDLIIKYPQVVDMKDKALQTKINELLKSQGGVDYKGQKDETYRQDYDVMLNKNGIMSILNTSYMYMKGAAHGMTMRSAINMDMTNGRLYELKDMFKPGADYKGKLNSIITKQLAEDDIPLLREYQGINDKQEYYLTDKELVIYYQLYDYTPYAYGFLEFYIPYESIRDIIDKDGPLGRVIN